MLRLKILLLSAILGLGLANNISAKSDTTFMDCTTIPGDSLRIDCWLEQGQYWWQHGEGEQAMSLGRTAYQTSLATENIRQQGLALRIITYSFYINGKYDSAAVYAEQAVHTFLSKDYYSEASRLYNDWGNSLRDQGKLRESTELYFKAIQLNEDLGRDSLNTAPYFNIATVFTHLDDQEKHIFYVKKANRLAKKHDQKRLSVISDLALAGIYQDSDQLDSAQVHAQAALQMGQQMQDNLLIAYAYINLANIAGKEKSTRQAVDLYKKAINMSGVPVFDQTRFKVFLAEFYQSQNQHQQANSILLEGIQEAEKINAQTLVSSFLKLLPISLAAEGKYQEAYDYLDRLNRWEKQQHEDELKAKVNEMGIQYETLQKEKENLALTTENAKQKAIIAEEKANARQRLLVASLLGFFLLGTILAFVFYQRQIQQKEALLMQEALIKDQKLTQLEQEQKIIAFKSMIVGEETERKRLAKELHDGLGGMLSNLKFALASPRPKSSKVSDEDIVTHARQMTDRASEELRRIAHNMMPQSLAKFGLITALEDLCDDINFSAGIVINFQHFNIDNSTLTPISLPVYRLLQELLNNIVKHAEATETTVQLSQNPTTLLVTVEDNGKGFEVEKALKEKGHGLGNLQSRVSALNGELEIDSRLTEGTSVQIQLPLQSD